MRILHIMPSCPCPPHFGAALRVYHLLKHMARNHEVTVIVYGGERERALMSDSFDGGIKQIHVVPPPRKTAGVSKRLAQLGSVFQSQSATTHAMYSEAMQAAIDRVLAHQTFDVIQLEHQHLGLFHVDSPGAIRILDAHNIESDNIRRLTRYSRSPLRRLYYELEYRKVRREESTVLAGQDALLVTSERDRWLIEEEFPHIPKFVIPNGVDTEFFHPSDQAPEPLSLVFTGAMNYLPNADGIGYFLREIFPIIRKEIPEVHVSVVGSGPPKWLERLADSNMTVTGYVNDVRPFVHRASVYVVPLRMGGGTRLKVLEAMAMKKPVVTTSIGCEGIDVVHNESALIADDPNEFAAAVVELVRNDRRRASIVDRGYDVVREKYEWSVVGDRLAGVYDTLLMKRTRRSVQERV